MTPGTVAGMGADQGVVTERTITVADAGATKAITFAIGETTIRTSTARVYGAGIESDDPTLHNDACKEQSNFSFLDTL